MAETKKQIAMEIMIQIQGVLTRSDDDQLIKELAEIAVKYNTEGFAGGENYGYMCLEVKRQSIQTSLSIQHGSTTNH